MCPCALRKCCARLALVRRLRKHAKPVETIARLYSTSARPSYFDERLERLFCKLRLKLFRNFLSSSAGARPRLLAPANQSVAQLARDRERLTVT